MQKRIIGVLFFVAALAIRSATSHFSAKIANAGWFSILFGRIWAVIIALTLSVQKPLNGQRK